MVVFCRRNAKFVHDSYSFSVLLNHGANVESIDQKGYTPLFYAASNCCLEILIELLDKGHANVKHVATDDKITALSKAHNYEAVMILTKYDAETNRNQDDMKRLMERHNVSSPKAILSQCISEVNEELLVLDLGHFKNTTDDCNEMNFHEMAEEHGKSDLLLHPIFQVFLDLKWNQVKKFYWFNLLLDIVFVILLTCSAYHFLNLIYCQPCDEIIDISWPMEINTKETSGTINCFSPFGYCYENEQISDWDKKQENCSKITGACHDPEKCANFTDSTTSKIINTYDTWKNHGIKCHKNFLRYVQLIEVECKP